MIQRIQTLYLAVSAILLAIMSFSSLGEIASDNNIYNFNIVGVKDIATGKLVYNGWPLITLLIITLALILVIIFSYKKRILQMRMATVSIILLIGLVLVSWYFISASQKELGDGLYSFKFPIIFPIVAAILNYLAIRSIAKDEVLIRSVDRIR